MGFAFLLCCIATVPFVDGRRLGSAAKTLHLANDDGDPWKEYMRFHAKEGDSVDNFVAETLSRVVRDTSSADGSQHDEGAAQIVTKYELSDDHHNEMVVHWAGAGSDVIVALTRDMEPSALSTSQVYISSDYGQTFQAKQDKMKLTNGGNSIIDKFYHSEADNSRYIFTDIIHSEIWVMRNFNDEFSNVQPGFKPTLLSTHKTDANVVLGMDSDDPSKKLWKSEDFGETWHVMQENVKSFWWGADGYDPPERVYVERQEPGRKSSIIYSDDYFDYESIDHEVIAEVEDFELNDEYMFATRKNVVYGNRETNYTLTLWVSHERGPFQQAQFPSRLLSLDFYIADASEHQVFVCVNHNKTSAVTHLYISESAGIEFSLSLENVVYFSPEGPGKDTWLSFTVQQHKRWIPGRKHGIPDNI